MTTMAEMKPGQFMLVQHKMDRGETREILYLREPDAETRYPYNVPVTRLRTMQGVRDKDHDVPRYDSRPYACSDPGEADGRTIVIDPWSSLWPELIVQATKSYRDNK